MSIFLNISALLISLAAFATSSFLAARQIGTAHGANQLPVINEIYKEVRSAKFRSEEELLWSDLPALGDDVGASELPDDLKEAFDNVCLLYGMLAYLVSLKIMDRRLAILPIHYRIVRTWNTVLPAVKKERIIRGSELSFLNTLESFVEFITRQNIQRIMEDINEAFE